MTILNTSRWRAVSSKPADTHTVIRIFHVELGVVWRGDIVSFPYRALSFDKPDSHLAISCTIEESRSNDHRGDKPHSCGRLCTARAGLLQTFPFYGLMVRDVVKRFYRADFTICLLSKVRHGSSFRSCMPFNLTHNHNPLIPYSHGSE